jgi:hypothetical protein
MSENRVLRGIFGHKRDAVTGGWRKLLNEELHNLYSSTDIIKMIKTMRMRWVCHDSSIIALMMEAESTSETSVNLYQSTRRNNPEDSHLHIHRRENLKCHQVLWFITLNPVGTCTI